MPHQKTITNRRAKYDYQLSEKIVAGIALSAGEVRHVRDQRVSIKNAFINIKGNEVWLQNMEIFYRPNELAGQRQNESHRLLLTKSQIKKLRASLSESNTIVPLRLILGGRYIKMEIAAALGKKKYDKRETIKQRDTQRDIKRELKKRQYNR